MELKKAEDSYLRSNINDAKEKQALITNPAMTIENESRASSIGGSFDGIAIVDDIGDAQMVKTKIYNMGGQALGDVNANTPPAKNDQAMNSKKNLTKDVEIKERKSRLNCCQPYVNKLLTKTHPLSEKPSIGERIHYAFLCPPHGIVATFITMTVMAILIWAVSWSILKKDALPGGNIFGLVILTIGALVGGEIVSKIKLPPLLGMLIVGFGLRNIPVINVAKNIKPDWSSTLRLMALVFILIRAGLGLDYEKLKKLSWAVLRLSLIPCGIEVVTVAVLSYFIFKFPWDWAFMLGFVHAAVSPAVVVPCMLQLQEKRLGIDKGIPTMLIAAGSIENVIAISGFSLVLGLTFSKGSLVWNILRCPTEIIIGLLEGIVGGLFCWYFPTLKSGRLVEYRFIFLIGGGLLAMFGSRAAGVPGSGALGCLVMAFIAGHGWRTRQWPNGQDPMGSLIGNVWLIFQPLLFGLIGAQVKVQDLNGDTIGWGTVIMCIALTLRTLATFLSSFCVHLKHKEKLFVALAWIPKATVQAAIGSLALDAANETGNQTLIDRGKKILAIAVFLILVTAPIGAILITLTAPKLLHKTPLMTEEQKSSKNDDDTIDKKSKQTNEAMKVDQNLDIEKGKYDDKKFNVYEVHEDATQKTDVTHM